MTVAADAARADGFQKISSASVPPAENLCHKMKRTLLAVGVIALVSLMFVPINYFGGSCTLCVSYGGGVFAPFFSAWEYRIAWGHFTRQTLFLSVLGAVLVNLLPRKPKK